MRSILFGILLIWKSVSVVAYICPVNGALHGDTVLQLQAGTDLISERRAKGWGMTGRSDREIAWSSPDRRRPSRRASEDTRSVGFSGGQGVRCTEPKYSVVYDKGATNWILLGRRLHTFTPRQLSHLFQEVSHKGPKGNRMHRNKRLDSSTDTRYIATINLELDE